MSEEPLEIRLERIEKDIKSHKQGNALALLGIRTRLVSIEQRLKRIEKKLGLDKEVDQ